MKYRYGSDLNSTYRYWWKNQTKRKE